MNYLTMLSILSTTMNKSSSIFCRSGSTMAAGFFSTVDVTFGSFINGILDFFTGLVYFMVKWMLYLVDVIFSYIQELAGLNINLSSMDAATSANSDIIFNLLYEGRNVVTMIVRSLLGLTVVVIIILSIIALVKAQYDSVKSGSAADLASVGRKTLKALVLLVVTPIIALLGIVASDALLVSLYNATNVNNSTSLGRNIFATSAMSANVYRLYANEGMRVPITCDFTKEEEILSYYENESVTDKFAEYLTSQNNAIYATYMMFNTAEFMTYKSLNTITNGYKNPDGSLTDEGRQHDAFYTIYDSLVQENVENNDVSGPLQQYQRIESYMEEYFVMADVIDYAMQTSHSLYFKTIQEVLDSVVNLKLPATADGLAIKNKLLFDIVNMFQITFLESDMTAVTFNTVTMTDLLDYYTADSWKAIRYSSDYFTPNKDGDPETQLQIEYTHLRDQTDELYGAKYIMAIEKDYIFGDVTYSYYYPMTYGYSFQAGYNFRSEYIYRGQMIAAKGIFYNSMYPTAIKQNPSTGSVMFYRDNIVQFAMGQTDDLFQLDWVDDITNGNVFQKIKVIFRMIFNPASLIPKIDVDTDAVQASYKKQVIEVNNIANGRLRIGYLMDSNPFISTNQVDSSTKNSIYGLSIQNLYKVSNLNFIILIMGTMILIKICFGAIFGLIGRAYDLFLLIIMYPTACAAIPLDDASYQSWFRKYMSKLLATYGFILAINFIFLLFPVIETMEFFTQDAVGTSIYIKRVAAVLYSGILFGWRISIRQLTNFLNVLVVIMFELVAFTMLETLPKMFATMTNGEDLTQSGASAEIQNTLKKMGEVTKKVTSIATGVGSFALGAGKFIFSSKARGDMMEKFGKSVKGTMKSMLPMNEAVTAAKDKMYQREQKKEQNKAKRDLKKALNSETTLDGKTDPEAKRKEVEQKLQAYVKAQQKYTKAIKNPGEMREADAKVKKEQKMQNAVTSARGEDGSVDTSAGSVESQRSNDELNEQIEMGRKMTRKLRRKVKSGRASAAEMKVYEEWQDVIDKSQAELDKRAKEDKDLKDARDKVAILKAKGKLSEAEQKQLEALEKQIKDIETIQTERVAKVHQRQVHEKEYNKKHGPIWNRRTQSQIDADQIKKDRETFIAGGGAGRQKIRNRINGELSDIEKELAKTGYTKSVKNAAATGKLDDLLKDPSLTPEQKALLEQYKQKSNYLGGLESLRAEEVGLRKTKRGRTSNGKKISLGHDQQVDAEISGIEAQIAKLKSEYRLKGTGMASPETQNKSYQDLMREIQQLEEQLKEKKERRKMYTDKTLRKNAVDFIQARQAEGIDYYNGRDMEEMIKEYIDNVYNRKHRKK